MKPTALLAFLALAGVMTSPLKAQTGPTGDYSAMLGAPPVILHLKLHVGAASGTLDFPDQGTMGIPVTDLHAEDGKFSFSAPSVHGTWTGTIADGGTTLAGSWSQGTPMPLTFTRDIVPAEKPSAVDGVWLGPGLRSNRVQIIVKSDAQGHEACTVDSIDQDTFGLPCANAVFAAPDFSFDVPSVKAHFAGQLSADGRALSGTFAGPSNTSVLNMTRQDKAVTQEPVKPLSTSAAIAPVDAAAMQRTLDQDFAQAFAQGALAPQTQAGVTIGVWQHGVRRVFAYGSAKPDSIYEIGSVTKTFTGLILACMAGEGRVKLDQPVRELLPPDTVARPQGREIVLVDLVTHRSGLPHIPDNLHPAEPNKPYEGYLEPQLYQFLAKHGLARPEAATFQYSNLGFGLLGQALSNRAGVSYEVLVKREIAAPLAMKDTTVSLTPAQQSRFITGHGPDHHEAPAIEHGAFAGAGALRSTADDLLNYLQAQLHPEKLAPAARKLAAAIRMSQELRASADPGLHIAFAWLHEDETGNYWHNGGTLGYSAYVFFNPQQDVAGVVLVNTSVSRQGSIADTIGQHIAQRFAGKPASVLW